MQVALLVEISVLTVVKIHSDYTVEVRSRSYLLFGDFLHISSDLSGARTATDMGHVTISNCYSRGNITSNQAGGICGIMTGSGSGTVTLTNLYEIGQIIHQGAAGLIGGISGALHEPKEVNITMSVYNGDADMIAFNGAEEKTIQEKNSGDLRGIIGTVYCYSDNEGSHAQEEEECWDNETIWQAVDGDFPILQDMPKRSPSASAYPTSPTPKTHTSTPTPTSTITNTETKTPSASSSPLYPTATKISSESGSWTPTITCSETETLTGSISPTLSPSGTYTWIPSQIGMLTSSGMASPSPTETITQTRAASPSKRTTTPTQKRRLE